MATSQEIKERIAVFARELREELGEVDDSDALSLLDAVENEAVQIGDAVHAELVKQQSINRPAEDESVCPACGQLGQYKGMRQRNAIGRRGPVVITEPEYYCPACRRAFFPDDASGRC